MLQLLRSDGNLTPATPEELLGIRSGMSAQLDLTLIDASSTPLDLTVPVVVVPGGVPKHSPLSAIPGLDGLEDALALKADLVGGLVPASQLPGFVDDVRFFANLAAFPATGSEGVLYIAIDSGRQYRWANSEAVYYPLPQSPGTTDDVPEGPSGTRLYYTDARALAAVAAAFYAKLNAQQSFTRGQATAPVTLGSISGAVTVDCSLSNNFYGTITGNITLTLTNYLPGQHVGIELLISGAGSYTVAISDADGAKFVSGVAAVAASGGTHITLTKSAAGRPWFVSIGDFA
ncbi:MAG: hypothetical protein ACKO0Z_02825 [Betaproteobacteria bacterium]